MFCEQRFAWRKVKIEYSIFALSTILLSPERTTGITWNTPLHRLTMTVNGKWKHQTNNNYMHRSVQSATLATTAAIATNGT